MRMIQMYSAILRVRPPLRRPTKQHLNPGLPHPPGPEL